jgi:uncharacterized membrane protein YeaQ/YmgE (transglycosylase-associated protein family)
VTIIVWLVIGAALGIGAAVTLRVEGGGAWLVNLTAGMVGAVGGGLAESRGSIGHDPWQANALIVTVAGALILVGIANLFRRRPAPERPPPPA